MFVKINYRAALLALITTFCAAASVQAQKAPLGNVMVPRRNTPMVGNATYIPSDIPVRSLKGVKGFEKTRVRIGGDNGASVTEKVVNITRTNVRDERVPVWSSDERFFFFAGNTTANAARYNLYFIATDEPQSATAATAVPVTDDSKTQYDYYFPAINVNSSRLAFVRSGDGKLVDDPTKRWDLYVSELPATGTFIDTAELGPTNLRSLTLRPDGTSRRFPSDATDSTDPRFTNVGRPAWIGSSDVVFAAQLEGDPNYHLFTVNITTKIIFQLTAGPADERNPQVSPDGRYLAFDSNAQPDATDNEAGQPGKVYNNVGTRARSATDRDAQPAAARAVGPTRNIFTCTVLGQNVRQFTLQYTDAPLTTVNSVQPTWSYANNANFLNEQGATFYLGWSSNRIPQFDPSDTEQSRVIGWAAGPATASGIYYAVASRDRGGSVLFEDTPINVSNVGANGARRLDTANDTLVNGRLYDATKPRYRDQYPTFAPFIRAFRMGFQSNRNGDYNVDGFGSGFSAPTPPTQNNLFIASVIDITAPTLIRFDTSTPVSEVVHINLVTNQAVPYNASNSVRNRSDGITPGSLLHFAVRVEDRGAGLRPENSPDGGAVYIQFKNPNSRYQTLQQNGSLDNGPTRGEHKEFYYNPNGFSLSSFAWVAIVNNAPFPWTMTNTGYNVGHEFECQAISAISTTNSAAGINTNADDPAVGSNYYSHRFNSFARTGAQPSLYTASVDDARAYAGSSMPPLDGQNGRANVWLRLTPLVELNADGTQKKDANGNPIPVRPADGKGGVLYGATWTIPSEAADWYMDVILYDNAVNPFDPTGFQRSNTIIYDNVWGFSSAPPIAGLATDILFVSDYTLGQKFFASRFGSSATDDVRSNNLVPIFWGAESYFTDTDLTRFPSERALNPTAPGTGNTPPTWDKFTPFWINPPGRVSGFTSNSGTPNVLGVEGYSDEILASGAVTCLASKVTATRFSHPGPSISSRT